MAVLIMGLSDIGFCVFSLGSIYVWVDVLDKGCGGINVQVYVGFRVFGFGQFLIEVLLFSCCESFVVQVDYCVCGVRLLSSLVSGVLAGSLAPWGILDQLT